MLRHTRTAGARRAGLLGAALVAVAAPLASLGAAAAFAAAKASVLVQPKRPASSYMVWLGENRAAIAEDLGEKGVAAVGKAAGERWGALSEKEKTTFEKKAAALKDKYNEDMEKFLAAGGVKAAPKVKATKSTGGGVKATKDPDAPKRPMSAYMLWLSDNREAILKSLPAGSSPVTAVAKEGGARWKLIAEKDRKKYDKRAAELKTAYQVAMERYTSKISA